MRFAKLNFEDFYSARALSTLQEAAKQHSGVLRDTDYSVPVFQGCVCTEHQPRGSWSSGRGGMASGSSTTPKTSLAGRCGVMAHGCVLGEAALEDSSFPFVASLLYRTRNAVSRTESVYCSWQHYRDPGR